MQEFHNIIKHRIIGNSVDNQLMKGKVILVTGGCGCVGSEIVRQVLQHNPAQVRIFDNWETGFFNLKMNPSYQSDKILMISGDIRDQQRLDDAMRDVDIVFHSAALKHVPICEHNPFESVQTNVIGTQNVVTTCIRRNVRHLVGISTDKAVNPVNTMGATKLLAERLITNQYAGLEKNDHFFSCVRFGNVLNSVGSVIPIFHKQISQGGPVTITSSKMTRFFMSINEAVELVIKAAQMQQHGKIFVLKMPVVKIVDLAEVLIEELAPKFGHNPQDIKIIEIGIRPGEKLYEELFTKEESHYVKDIGDMFVLSSTLFPGTPANNNRSVYGTESEAALPKESIRNLLYDKKILSKD